MRREWIQQLEAQIILIHLLLWGRGQVKILAEIGYGLFWTNAEKMPCEMGLHFSKVFFFCASISGFIHNSMSIGFFAHLYVEIIQHEGIMDCLKKILID